jgi:hypothetical protein
MSNQGFREFSAAGSEEGVLIETLLPRRKFIVVIGIDAYQRQPKLRCAVADALGIQQLFVQRFGFEAPIAPLLDAAATKPAIESLVDDQLRNIVRPEDALVFFFAGHGTTRLTRLDGVTLETGYLAPVEARGFDQYSDLVNMEELLRRLGMLPARHILVVLDACHSGMALGSAVSQYRSTESYLHKLAASRSRRVLTSASRDQLALDTGPIPGHSLFTGVMIHALTSGDADMDGNGVVTFSELALAVQQRVGQSSGSQQTPDFGAFYMDDRGELLLPMTPEAHRLRVPVPGPPAPHFAHRSPEAPPVPPTPAPPNVPAVPSFAESLATMAKASIKSSIVGTIVVSLGIVGYFIYLVSSGRTINVKTFPADAGVTALLAARMEERQKAGCTHVVKPATRVTGEAKVVLSLTNKTCLSILALPEAADAALTLRMTDLAGKELDGAPAPQREVNMTACAPAPGEYHLSIRAPSAMASFSYALLDCPKPALEDPALNGEQRVTALLKERFGMGCRDILMSPKTFAAEKSFTGEFRAGNTCIALIAATGVKDNALKIELKTPFGEKVTVPAPALEHSFLYCPNQSGPHDMSVTSAANSPFTFATVTCPASVRK